MVVVGCARRASIIVDIITVNKELHKIQTFSSYYLVNDNVLRLLWDCLKNSASI